MNEKTYRVLEYDKIIELLKEKAASEMTKNVISGLKPSSDICEIRDMMAETTEATQVIVRKGVIPLGAFYDIGDSLYLARKGGTLNTKQLLRVLYNLNTAAAVSSFLKSDLPPLPIIDGIREVIAVEKSLAEKIDRCILSEDEISDNASTELRNIRRSIARQNETIRARMNHILNSADNKSLLQDAIVTMRDGRYVIPVKQEHRGKFQGIIHDQSQSGATLFIEPQVIVNLNNELREMELAEKIEIERILAELSGNVAEHFYAIMNNQELLLKLDFIFAKGKLSAAFGGEEASVNENGILNLRDARHPLIDPRKVVPINVSLGRDYRTLVITGPNTGGKTVTLKTVGLMAMMVQSGLHIPANSGTEMPVFKKIYADIGDEQSIEQSLSTFSSHINNIVNIVKDGDRETLILLDELGAGTDPTEGSALAIAILDYLKNKGALTMATTHYNELKKYAISREGVQNASMEFNVETLSPTYRLSVGVPGRSNAFEISEKLGLEPDIIVRARRLLESGDIEFEEVISALERDKKAAEAELEEATMLKIAMKKQKEQIDRLEKSLTQQKEKIITGAREEARGIIREAQELSKEISQELKELSKAETAGERNRRYSESKKRLREADMKYRDRVVLPENENPVAAGKLKVGDRVKVLALDQTGEVLTLPDDKGDLFVQVGMLKVSVNAEALSLINERGSRSKGQKDGRYGAMYMSKTRSVPMSINVLGQNLDDAIMDIHKYLDDAFMAGLPSVSIIHGRGEGILRKGISEMLSSHKHVEKFRRGSYNEGGDGVTIVTLRK